MIKLLTLLSIVFMTATQAGQAPGTPLKTGMDIRTPLAINVDAVKVDNFTGNVTIKSVGSGQAVKVALQGPDEVLQKITVIYDKKILSIAFTDNVPIIKDLSSIKLSIEMPASMPLSFTLVGGKAVIGPRTADTETNISGYGEISLETVHNFSSKIDGSGDITLANIHGKATLSIRGDGNYHIQNGTISDLNAVIQGTGLITINAPVTNATLDSEGAGTIKLLKGAGKLTQSVSGAGTISIS